MRSTIEPRQTVLYAALPLPMHGLSLLHEVVERLYGTGESMLDFSEPESVRVTAPADGFGPRVTGPLTDAAAADAESGLFSSRIDGDTLELSLENAQEVTVSLAHALALWFDVSGGINYVTAVFYGVDDTTEPTHHLTVQKIGKPTGHDLRKVAEARVSELEQLLETHGINPDGSTPVNPAVGR